MAKSTTSGLFSSFGVAAAKNEPKKPSLVEAKDNNKASSKTQETAKTIKETLPSELSVSNKTPLAKNEKIKYESTKNDYTSARKKSFDLRDDIMMFVRKSSIGQGISIQDYVNDVICKKHLEIEKGTIDADTVNSECEKNAWFRGSRKRITVPFTEKAFLEHKEDAQKVVVKPAVWLNYIFYSEMKNQ